MSKQSRRYGLLQRLLAPLVVPKTLPVHPVRRLQVRSQFPLACRMPAQLLQLLLCEAS